MVIEAKGKVLLSGFDLAYTEKVAVEDLINNYANKINQRTGFQEIRLRLKKAQHGKAFLHEVQGTLKSEISNKEFKAKITDYNLFSAVSETLERLMKEAEHKKRRKSQIRK